MTVIGSVEVEVRPLMGAFGAELAAQVQAATDRAMLDNPAVFAGVTKGAERAGATTAEELAAGGALGGQRARDAIKTGLDGAASDAEKGGTDIAGRLNEHIKSGLGGLGNALGMVGLPLAGLGDRFDSTAGKAGVFSGKLGAISAVGAGTVVAVGAAVGVMASLGDKFEQSTAQMAAAGDIPIKVANQIGQAFLHEGSNIIFSASQQEQAFGAIAGQLTTLPGYVNNAANAEKFMKTSMDLAEESGNALASTTADLSKELQLYQLPASAAAGASTELFNTSRLTGTSIDTVSQSLGQLRAQLGAAAPSLSDSSALIVDLTEHGETGSRVLRSLGTVFQGLLNPSKAVADEQKKLGVSFKDARTGGLLPLRDIIGEVAPKLQGMSDTQATAELKSLGFGAASLKLAQTIKAGIPAFDAATKAANDQGAAHHALEVQQQTLGHETESLKTSFLNAATSMGLVLLPAVKDVLGAVGDFFGFLESHKDLMYALAAVIGVVLAGAVAVFTVNLIAAAVAAASTAAAALAVAAPFLAIAAAVAVVAFGIYELVTHWSAVWGAIKSAAESAWHFLDGIWHAIEGGIREAFGRVEAFFKQWWQVIVGVVFGGPVGLLIGLFVKFHKQIFAEVSKLAEDVAGFFSRMWSAVTGFATRIWHDVAGFFSRMASDISGDVQRGVNAVVGYFTALPGRVVTGLGNIARTITAPFVGIADWVYNNVIKPILKFFGDLPGEIGHAISSIPGMVGKTLENAIPGGHAIGGAVSSVGGAFSSAGSAIAGIFAEGGIVPGLGPQLAVVHGGEYILTVDQVAKLAGPGGVAHAAAASPGGSPSAPGASGGVTIMPGAVTQTFNTPMSAPAVANEVGWALRVAPVSGLKGPR